MVVSLDPEVISSQLGVVDGQIQRSVGSGGEEDLKHKEKFDFNISYFSR